MNDLNFIHDNVRALLKAVNKVCVDNNLTYTLGYGSVLGAVRHKGFIPWDSDIDILIPYPEMDAFRTAMEKGLPGDMELLEWDRTPNYHPCFDRVVYKGMNHAKIHIDVFPLCGLPESDEEKEKFIRKCQRTYKFFHCKYQDVRYSHKNRVLMICLIKALLQIYPDTLIRKRYKEFQEKYDYDKAKDVYSISSCYDVRDYTVKADIFDTIRVPFDDLEVPIPRNYDKYLTHLYGDYMTPKKY